MSLSKFLDPKNDVAFKRIFGSEKNKEILIHFLNDLLIFEGKVPIVEVTFLKTAQDPEIALHKQSIVDVSCRDERGNTHIVEMQVAKDKGFLKRAQYYAARAYGSQLGTGAEFHNLKEVIFLAIVGFNLFPKKNGFISNHVILDESSKERDLRDFSFTFLELSKFRKQKSELTTMIDRWAYFFKYTDDAREVNLPPLLEREDGIIKKAYEELDRFNWNQEELNSYEWAEKQTHCYYATLEQKFDEGLEEGEKRGIKRGEEIGEKRGLRMGEEIGEKRGFRIGEEIGEKRGEKRALWRCALSLLKTRIPLTQVAECTGLSLTELAHPPHEVIVELTSPQEYEGLLSRCN